MSSWKFLFTHWPSTKARELKIFNIWLEKMAFLKWRKNCETLEAFQQWIFTQSRVGVHKAQLDSCTYFYIVYNNNLWLIVL